MCTSRGQCALAWFGFHASIAVGPKSAVVCGFIACGEAETKTGSSLPPLSTQGEVQHVSEGRHRCGHSGLVALGACLADVLPKKPFLVFVFVDLHVRQRFLFR